MKLGNTVLALNHAVAMTLLLIATTMTSFRLFQQVHSLPASERPNSISSIATESPSQDGFHKGGRGQVKNEEEQMDGRVRRDDGLVQENETATSVIYHANEQLLRDFPDWLVEIDIVRSPLVEEFRRTGVDEGPHGNTESSTVNSDNRKKKAAFNGYYHEYLYWPDARVPYAFHPYVEQEARVAVLEAMDHWMAYTCIEFVPVGPDEEAYVEFIEMYGCWSYVGRQGRDQKVSIGLWHQYFCKQKGVLLHEIGHSLGFFHEQTRPDRDNYIRILWENMISTAYTEFLRYSSYEVDSLSVPYDYSSIMHYPSNAFTRNGKDTIVPLEPGVKVLGQRNSLSPLDIKQANLLYNCKRMRNDTEISDHHLNVIDPIPDDAFQIQNSKTNTCLTATKFSNEHTPGSSPSAEKLYIVSMAECNPSFSQQFWQWTSNDSIINVGNYLCLTTLRTNSSNNNTTDDVEMLVLKSCFESDRNQKWSCSGRYIQQPTSGKCLSAPKSKEGNYDLESRDLDLGEEDDGEVIGPRRRRNTHLMEMVEELGQFLHDIDEQTSDDDEQEYSNSQSESQSRNDTTDRDIYQTMASAQYCRLYDEFQMWDAITKDNISNFSTNSSLLTNYEKTICSQDENAEHTLPPCYVNNMDSISHVLLSSDLEDAEWITCDKHGYYVTGFYHTHLSNTGMHLRDGLITGMQCCATRSVFTGEAGSPVPDSHEDDCDEVEWWSFHDILMSEGWFSCPKGKFLKGFEIGPNESRHGVHRIYKARCCRRHTATDVYEHCYTDQSRKVDDTGVHTCRMKGYIVTAMYLDRCTGDGECTEKLTCCIES